jgi:hypothetical protein
MDVRSFVPLTDFLDKVGLPWHWQYLAECVIFVVLGSVLSVAITQPTTPAQAVTAGFGWTGFFTVPRKRQSKPTREPY